MTLETFFKTVPQAALGFSGGTDSAYVLHQAVQAGIQIQPYYIKSAFQPTFELEHAQQLCAQLNISLTVLELDVTQNLQIVQNGKDRCYHCKKSLFSALMMQAEKDGFSVILDGTNASDDASDRPGMQALHELKVRSPLRECGISKQQVREASRKANLFTWNKPAYACLATRIPTGQMIESTLLTKVEQAENELFALGFSDFRVRVLGTAAQLQLPQEQWQKAISLQKTLQQKLKAHFSAVLLDLAPRSAEEGLL